MKLSFLISFVAILLPSVVTAAELTIIINQLRSNAGIVHIALYNAPEKFPDSDGMISEINVPAEKPSIQWTFKNLKSGQYAIATYHDENGNDEFDQGFLGIPLEGYAFSNNATVFFGPPDFTEAAFTVSEINNQQTIIMDY